MIENFNYTNCNQFSPIQRFYADANIFITGGTGFLGKLLIEKLLRSCPEINKIYLLIRQKRGKGIEERVDDLLSDVIFKDCNKLIFKTKLFPISGDCGENALGINEFDMNLLIENVNIVFHAAATVRFDERLKLATTINIGGVKHLLYLCQQIKHLKSVVHVSTAYSNCHVKEIDEVFHNYDMEYEELLELLDKYDDETINNMTKRILGKWPNTYSFTKAMGESIIQRFGNTLPIGVFRPSIVSSTYKEPVKGWVDNLFGPAGGTAAGLMGLLKSVKCDENMVADIVPADMCINALIATAWDVNGAKNKKNLNIPIYNYVSSVEKPITWGEFHNINLYIARKYPAANAVRYIDMQMSNNIFWTISMMFEHKLPAFLADIVMYCCGQNTRFIKIYGKLEKYCNVIKYFTTRSWTFRNRNVQELWKKLNETDKSMFNFDINNLDWFEYCQSYTLGIRTFVLKEDLSTVASAKKRQLRFYYLRMFIKNLLYIIGLYSAWKWMSLTHMLSFKHWVM